MTRLAVMSDIHANMPALRAVIDDLLSQEVDHVIVAGDIINWGPQSVAVLERILSEGWALIRGNHELYLLDANTPREPDLWKQHGYTLPSYLRKTIKGRLFNVIAALPDTLQLRYPDAPPVRVYHGTPGNPWVGIYPATTEDQIRELLKGVEETTVILAHTHLTLDRQVDDWHILNPGSVGNPLDGEPAAKYMILNGDAEGWKAELRRVDYDRELVYKAFRQERLEAQVGITAYLVEAEIRESRVRAYACQKWAKETHPDKQLNRELADYFLHNVDVVKYLPENYVQYESSTVVETAKDS